jgi:anthranilate synthase component 1
VRTTTDRCLRAGANTHCITSAEEKHLAEQEDGEGERGGESRAASLLEGDAKTRISLVAG